MFNKYKGKKWLAEILSEKMEKATCYGRRMKQIALDKLIPLLRSLIPLLRSLIPLLRSLICIAQSLRTAAEELRTALTWRARVRRVTVAFRRMSATFGRNSGANTIESIPLPYAGPTTPPNTTIVLSRTGPTPPTRPMAHLQHDYEDKRNSNEASERPSDASPTRLQSSPEPGAEISSVRARFMSIVRHPIVPIRPIRIGEAEPGVSGSLTDGKAIDRTSVAATMLRISRVAGLVPRLENMAPSQDIPAHVALVRHMQVSVNQVVTFPPVINLVPSFPRTGSSWPPLVGIAPQLYSMSGYVSSTSISLRRITERLFRRNSLPIVCCCISPDSLVKLRGKSGFFGNNPHE